MRSNGSLTAEYAQRLDSILRSRWRRYLGVQVPYRWNLQRLAQGLTLEVGCGAGRNLGHLRGRIVGVDPNAACVEAAKRAGLEAMSPEEFTSYYGAASFDSLLFSHVLEHCTPDEGAALVARYLPYLKPGGRVILQTPQEWGYRSDPTHVHFVTDETLAALCVRLGLTLQRSYSFPFPRWVGPLFRFNEFNVLAVKP